MPTRFERFGPLATGVLLVGFAVIGHHHRTAVANTDAGSKVLTYLQSHGSQAGGGAFALLLAAVAGVFFFGFVRRSLGASSHGEWLATIGFGGALLLGVGALIEAGIDFALDDVGTHIEAPTAQMLNILQSDLNPMLINGGLALAMLGFGLAIVRTDLVARWLGWAGIGIGVLAVAGPLVSLALPLAAVWIVAIGVTFALRTGDATPATVGGRVHNTIPG